METTIEMSRMYETLLAAPGMNQSVKISLTISRKTALLLNQLIENGIVQKTSLANPELLPRFRKNVFRK